MNNIKESIQQLQSNKIKLEQEINDFIAGRLIEFGRENGFYAIHGINIAASYYLALGESSPVDVSVISKINFDYDESA